MRYFYCMLLWAVVSCKPQADDMIKLNYELQKPTNLTQSLSETQTDTAVEVNY